MLLPENFGTSKNEAPLPRGAVGSGGLDKFLPERKSMGWDVWDVLGEIWNEFCRCSLMLPQMACLLRRGYIFFFFLPWHWRWFSSVAPTRRKTLLSTWSPPSKDQTCSLPFCCAQFCRRIEGSGRTLFPRGPVHIMATHQAWSHVLMGGYLKNLALQSWDLRVSTQVPQNEVVASVSEVNLQAGRGRYELDMGT